MKENIAARHFRDWIKVEKQGDDLIEMRARFKSPRDADDDQRYRTRTVLLVIILLFIAIAVENVPASAKQWFIGGGIGLLVLSNISRNRQQYRFMIRSGFDSDGKFNLYFFPPTLSSGSLNAKSILQLKPGDPVEIRVAPHRLGPVKIREAQRGQGRPKKEEERIYETAQEVIAQTGPSASIPTVIAEVTDDETGEIAGQLAAAIRLTIEEFRMMNDRRMQYERSLPQGRHGAASHEQPLF